MSSYSFSHQFYQRWMQAPEPIRAAIVQELTDITSLLQTDTPFEEFVFSNDDLDAHLDNLYHAHKKQQAAAKEIADKQAALRIAAEKKRVAEEKQAAEKEVRAKAEAERQEEARQQAEKISQEKDDAALKKADSTADTVVKISNEADTTSKDSSSTKNSDNVSSGHISSDNISSTNGVTDRTTETTIMKPKKGAAVDLSLKDTVVNAAHEELIHELEMHVDDYLSEQMMQISEDLKSWLRAEVSRQLNEISEKNHTPDHTSDSGAKK